MPPIGEIFLKSGRIAAGVNPGLFWITFATTPANAAAASTGASRPPMAIAQCVIRPLIVWLVTSGCAIRSIVSVRRLRRFAAMAGPAIARAPAAASRTAVELTSWERAT